MPSPQLSRCVVLVLVGGLTSFACSRGESPAAEPPPPTAVTTGVASERAVVTSIAASGSFAADELADVASQTAGVVIETPASVGQFVSANAVLVRLDNREARLRLDQASAVLQQAESEAVSAREAAQTAASQATLAEANASRYAELLKSGDIPQTTYEQAVQQRLVADSQARLAQQRLGASQAGVAGARAQVALATKAEEDTLIRAPFAGFVTERAATLGEYVVPGLVAARVVKTSPILLHALIPETEAARITVGAPAVAQVAAYPGREFQGRVRVLSPTVDATTRTMTAQIAFANGDNTLRPGMFGTVRLSDPVSTRVVLIPRAAAAVDGPGDTHVFVISGDVATSRRVRLGDAQGDLILVISGVTPGEVVATSGLTRLRDGMRVHAEAR
jgi:RND family efflux transporter MFP subunit